MNAVSTENNKSITPNLRRFGSLMFFIVLCFAVAATGALFSPDDWYASLTRPGYAPPNWVFGPVWTVLYLMMGFSGWLVWQSPGPAARRLAMIAFGVQLLLNAAWSAIFFGLHQPGWALVEICMLWTAILTTILLFRRYSTVAAALLTPYLAWVSYATVLNYGFWSLN